MSKLCYRQTSTSFWGRRADNNQNEQMGIKMKTRRIGARLVVTLLLLSVVSAATAQQPNRDMIVNKAGQGPKRWALVIGNSNYEGQNYLPNPANDATDVAKALYNMGFDVAVERDLDQQGMERAIQNFGAKIRGGGVSLFYYAGHAVQVNGQNYLIPLRANITKEAEARYKAVDVGLVLAQIEGARNLINIIVLDACRNNPLPRSYRSPTASDGLAPISPHVDVETFISYATAPGKVASDGGGRNSPFTEAFLEELNRSAGMKIEDIFKRIRASVIKKTGGAQVPWDSSSLTADFYFKTDTPNRALIDLSHISEARKLGGEGKKAEAQEAYRRAESIYRQAVKGEPGKAAYHNYLGLALSGQSRHAEAEAEYRQAARLEIDNATYHSNVGIAFSQQKKLPEAEAAYRRAIQLAPDKAEYHNYLGIILRRQVKYQAAEAAYRKAIQLDQRNVLFRVNLGLILELQNNYTSAESEYRKALDIDTKSVNVLRALGDNLIEQNKQLNEAFQMIRQAVEAEPNNLIYLGSRGWAHFKLGRIDEALNDLNKAATDASLSETAQAKIQERLGDVYYNRYKVGQARAAWQMALTLAIDPPQIARLKTKLGGQ